MIAGEAAKWGSYAPSSRTFSDLFDAHESGRKSDGVRTAALSDDSERLLLKGLTEQAAIPLKPLFQPRALCDVVMLIRPSQIRQSFTLIVEPGSGEGGREISRMAALAIAEALWKQYCGVSGASPRDWQISWGMRPLA